MYSKLNPGRSHQYESIDDAITCQGSDEKILLEDGRGNSITSFVSLDHSSFTQNNSTGNSESYLQHGDSIGSISECFQPSPGTISPQQPLKKVNQQQSQAQTLVMTEVLEDTDESCADSLQTKHKKDSKNEEEVTTMRVIAPNLSSTVSQKSNRSNASNDNNIVKINPQYNGSANRSRKNRQSPNNSSSFLVPVDEPQPQSAPIVNDLPDPSTSQSHTVSTNQQSKQSSGWNFFSSLFSRGTDPVSVPSNARPVGESLTKEPGKNVQSPKHGNNKLLSSPRNPSRGGKGKTKQEREGEEAAAGVVMNRRNQSRLRGSKSQPSVASGQSMNSMPNSACTSGGNSCHGSVLSDPIVPSTASDKMLRTHPRNATDALELKILQETEREYLTNYFFSLPIFSSFRNQELMDEYSSFSVNQRSFMVMFSCCCFFSFSFFMAVCSAYLLRREHPNYYSVSILMNCSWIMNLFDSTICWIMLFRQTTLFYRLEQTAKEQMQLRRIRWFELLRQYTPALQYYLLITLTLGYCFRLNARVLSGDCDHHNDLISRVMAEWSCNDYAKVQALPLDTMIAMMLTPIAYPAIIRECRMDVVILSSTLILLAMLIAIVLLGSANPLYYYVPYCVTGGFIAADLTQQNIASFVLNKRLKMALVENQKMATQTEIEMRHVLGNVAHDFKTVSLPYYCHILCHNVLYFSLN